MRSLLVVVFICAYSTTAFTQSSSLPPVITSQYTLGVLSTAGVSSRSTLQYGIPMEPGKFIGDFYLDKKWNKTTILLYEKERLLEGYLTRFDLSSSQLEVRLTDGVKVLDISKIKSVVWIDSLTSIGRYFLNAKDYMFGETKLLGLLEVLVDGKVPLFKRVTVDVKKANYNVALNVGSRDDKVIKDEEYYFTEGSALIEINGKKKFLEYFKNHAPQLESFISKNDLSLSKERDLKVIFQHINSL